MLVLNMTIVVIGMMLVLVLILKLKRLYAFLDVERRFGNGNKNSYQINGGFIWAL